MEDNKNRENSSKDRKNGTSKYIGVCWNKIHKKWMSRIRINKKQKHLGYFDTEKEAADAYQKELKILQKTINLKAYKQWKT